MRAHAARGFTTPTLKVILALVFALGGVGWAAYTAFGSGGSEKDAARGEVIATAVDDEGNEVEPNYTKAKSNKQVEQVSGEITNRIQDLGQGLATIQQIAGASGNEGIASATVNALVPLIRGDFNSFVAAIEAMGGRIADLDTDNQLFKHLTEVFKDASVDVDRITVAKYEPFQRGMRREVEVNEEIDNATDGDEPRFNMNERVMMMTPQAFFPDAPDRNDDSAIEVRIPMKQKGEGESIFGLILTWNKDARLWQPAAYSVIKRELVVEDD